MDDNSSNVAYRICQKLFFSLEQFAILHSQYPSKLLVYVQVDTDEYGPLAAQSIIPVAEASSSSSQRTLAGSCDGKFLCSC